MTIWLLAFILFACLGYAGFALGAIRAAATFVGLIVAAFLAVPLGHMFYPLLSLFGVKNPILVWLLGPFITFIVILAVFKVIGFGIHSKVNVHFKYKASETLVGLYKRLSRRLGMCLGFANAAIYLILICWVIYALSYPISQTVTADAPAPFTVGLLNRAGHELQTTGMAKVAASIDSMPQNYYDISDLIGLIYHNDLLESRLTSYPAFLILGEKSEFQDIAKDKEFEELRQRQPPIMEIIDRPQMQTVINNPDLLNEIWSRVEPNLADLKTYIATGKSPKYDSETIVGHWTFNIVDALNYIKRTKPNIGAQEMKRTRFALVTQFGKTTMVATSSPEKQVAVKQLGKMTLTKDPKKPFTVEKVDLNGTWTGEDGKYKIAFPDKEHGNVDAIVEGDQLTITGLPQPITFERD